MADHSSASSYSEIQEIRKLLWGPYVKEDVFRRWAQGECSSLVTLCNKIYSVCVRYLLMQLLYRVLF